MTWLYIINILSYIFSMMFIPVDIFTVLSPIPDFYQKKKLHLQVYGVETCLPRSPQYIKSDITISILVCWTNIHCSQWIHILSRWDAELQKQGWYFVRKINRNQYRLWFHNRVGTTCFPWYPTATVSTCPRNNFLHFRVFSAFICKHLTDVVNKKKTFTNSKRELFLQFGSA